ncbi:MAG: PQQ-binding-like beta-propeller repeat protein [Pirellulales bacterium]
MKMHLIYAIRFRRPALVVWMLIAGGLAASADAQLTSGLISQGDAASAGLKRAWFARAEVNPARSHVVDWVLADDELLILTDLGVLQALDANTGQTLWTTQFGNPNYPSLGPGSNGEYVAVINGSTLYLLDRKSGKIQSQRKIGGAPGAAPALGKDHVFVPTLTGLIEGYPLEPNAAEYERWFYQSYGNTMVAPLVTPHSVVWSTDRGYLYVSGSTTPGVRYRLEAGDEFDARAAFQEPLIYAVTRSGELFALDEESGALRWRYMTGFPTDRAPAAVGTRLFLTSDEPMLHCLDAKTGLPQWQVPGIDQFAAATKNHVYGVDRFGTIHILNIADGSPVGRIANDGSLKALVNDQTDRLFLISEAGLVQCLHEIGADKPTHYGAAPKTEAPSGAGQEPAAEQTGESQPATAPAVNAPAEEPAATTENPFSAGAQEAAPPAKEESSFGTGDENPFEQ